jgi:hypothetical protein
MNAAITVSHIEPNLKLLVGMGTAPDWTGEPTNNAHFG